MTRAICFILCLLAIAIVHAQSDESSETAPDAPAIHALKFGTYELGWIRFKNIDADGERKLDADKGITFPFMRVNNGTTRLRLDDMDAETIADLIETHEIAFDENAIAGQCDPNKLPGARADLFCVPGTSGMPRGQIFLALFDGETGDLLALTESIDNNAGGALRDWSPTPEAAENQAAAATGCGPYVAGQWIKAADYAASGLDLPLRYGGHDPAKVTDYTCVVAADGSAHLLAYNLAEVGTAGGVNGGGGGNGGANGSAGASNAGYGIDRRGNDDDDGNVGDPIPDPCTHPLGCDDDDGDE